MLASRLRACARPDAGPLRQCRPRATPLSVQLLQGDEDEEDEALPLAIGPVRAEMAGGAGRALVAARAVAAGETLLVCRPLALLRAGAPRGGRPHPADLVDAALDACWEAAAAAAADGEDAAGDDDDDDDAEALAPLAWLLTLHAGDEGEGAAAAAEQRPLPALEPDSRPASLAVGLPPSSFEAARAALDEWRRRRRRRRPDGGGNDDGAPPQPPPHARAPPWLQRRAAAVVKANAVGEEHGDLAAALVALRPPSSPSSSPSASASAAADSTRGHVCLFPAFSLLNHDCSPSAVHLTLRSGAAVVVRAARQLRENEAVTISYLGRPQLRPLGERRSALQEGYGFECACARCAREEAALADAGWGEVSAAGTTTRGAKAPVSSPPLSPAREAAAEAAAAAETLAVRAEGEWAPDARWAARAMARLDGRGGGGGGGGGDGDDGDGDDSDQEQPEPASLSAKERAALRRRALSTAARVARAAGGASRALAETAALAARGGGAGGARALRQELAASAYAALEAAADAEGVLAAEAERKWRKRCSAAANKSNKRRPSGGGGGGGKKNDVASARAAAAAAASRAAALAACASALEGVSAGSDLHCAVAAQRCAALGVWREAAAWGGEAAAAARAAGAGEAEQEEEEEEEEAPPPPPAPPPPSLVDAAQAACDRAHVIRYGNDLPREYLDALIAGSLEMYA